MVLYTFVCSFVRPVCSSFQLISLYRSFLPSVLYSPNSPTGTLRKWTLLTTGSSSPSPTTPLSSKPSPPPLSTVMVSLPSPVPSFVLLVKGNPEQPLMVAFFLYYFLYFWFGCSWRGGLRRRRWHGWRPGDASGGGAETRGLSWRGWRVFHRSCCCGSDGCQRGIRLRPQGHRRWIPAEFPGGAF